MSAILERFGLTLDAWKSADAAWSAALLHAAQQADLAGVKAGFVEELVFRLFQQRARVEKAAVEPWLEDFLPAWTAPVRTGEGTVPLRSDALQPPALPFRATKSGAPAPPPRLSIIDHAILCAEIAVKAESVERLLGRRGLSMAEKDALDEHYRRLVVRDPRAQTEWQSAFERRRRELLGAGR